MKRFTVLLICLCLLMTGCTAGKAGESSSVSLWYIRGDSLEPLISDAAESSGLTLELRPFESMAELSLELQGRRPDLLLCSYEAAATLQEQGMLKSISLEGLDYRSGLCEAYPGFGTGFFPVGASVELLCGREPMDEQSLEGFVERLYERDETMTADSFSRLISSALMQKDAQLKASRHENASDESYVYFHNLLAEAAFSGRVASYDEGAAELLRQGRVDWALINSAALASTPEEWHIAPVPAAEGGERKYLADMRGLAYLGNTFDNSAATAKLLKLLLCAGRGRELSLEAGLVPAQSWDGAAQEGELYSALYELYSSWELVYPSPVSGFVMGRQALEDDFRTALSHLQ